LQTGYVFHLNTVTRKAVKSHEKLIIKQEWTSQRH